MSTDKFNHVIDEFKKQFTAQITVGLKRLHREILLNIEIVENTVLFKITYDEHQHVLSVPIPYNKNGVMLLSVGDVTRSVCQYYLKVQNKRMSYIDVIFKILFEGAEGVLPENVIKNNRSAVRQIRHGCKINKLSLFLYSIQKMINHIVNDLPIHKTDFNSLVMNHRITILDPIFDIMANPEEQHSYQVLKNVNYFDYGWTSLGLSDGSLADKNYMLDCDIRKLSPFGKSHHNPQRNLYSTLGMKGDETPLIHSETTSKLSKLGLTRKGWNLFTIFVDIPDVWEDQLMVDISHKDKYVEYDKKYICYGEVAVKEGQIIFFDEILSIADNKTVKKFNIYCDFAKVTSIKEVVNNIGGLPQISKIVTVIYRRCLKDGTKLTNLAANKGVIRMKDLGYATNPKTGKKQKIDIIVSSKAVVKRKNYTQVLEAILNTVNDNNPIVVEDDTVVSEESIVKALTSSGYKEDGTWECNTYAGKFNCVAGKVFWGVTHDADDTVWQPETTTLKNNRDLRTSGLKFSTIEFRALSTRFGMDNPIEKEILSHAQGHEDIYELLEVLKFKIGKTSLNNHVANVKDVIPLKQDEGIMALPEELVGTIVDPDISEKGFMLKLPIDYQINLGSKFNILSEGFPYNTTDELNGEEIYKKITFNSIYVPYGNLRRCWLHEVGKFGLSDIGAALNNIVVLCHEYIEDSQSGKNISTLYKTIFSYFNLISTKLSTKTGEISTHGMSVRYPNSAKGVATLSNNLKPNTIEIHSSMAKSINVSNGDIVLVERFPCLGFMSLRPQKIKITNNPLCKYTIRVSGNSLGSLSLDFDGDVLFIASFHTKEARQILKDEFYTPNKECHKQIEKFNEKMGVPRTKEMCLGDYKIKSFDKLTNATHACIVDKLTGVKSNTGPVVALAYNVLRIMENSQVAGNQRLECAIEVFVDTVANSVFGQKHGIESLHKVVTNGICSADAELLKKEGFNPEISEVICNEIKKKAKELGVFDVAKYHEAAKKAGKSSIINKIVREQNKLYFTSRASLEGCNLIKNVMEYKVVDTPSKIFSKIMASPTKLQIADEEALASIRTLEARIYCEKVFKSINAALEKDRGITIVNRSN